MELSPGVTVLAMVLDSFSGRRFLDVDVKRNMEGVLLSLNRWIGGVESNNG